eukprot:COSAG01_NODE_3078_length_6628_cov_30.180885_4_plen_358_part_00
MTVSDGFFPLNQLCIAVGATHHRTGCACVSATVSARRRCRLRYFMIRTAALTEIPLRFYPFFSSVPCASSHGSDGQVLRAWCTSVLTQVSCGCVLRRGHCSTCAPWHPRRGQCPPMPRSHPAVLGRNSLRRRRRRRRRHRARPRPRALAVPANLAAVAVARPARAPEGKAPCVRSTYFNNFLWKLGCGFGLPLVRLLPAACRAPLAQPEAGAQVQAEHSRRALTLEDVARQYARLVVDRRGGQQQRARAGVDAARAQRARADVPVQASTSSIFRGKNRRDIGKSQPKGTACTMETAGVQHGAERVRPAARPGPAIDHGRTMPATCSAAEPAALTQIRATIHRQQRSSAAAQSPRQHR